jgi:hypothetical protein
VSGRRDQHALIQRAIAEAVASGHTGLLLPPGDYGVERSSPPLYVPGGFTLKGARGRSRVLALGSVFPEAAAFPVQSGALVAVASIGGDPELRYGERYLKETGRVGGTDATFVVTAQAGKAVSVAVAAGGKGHRAGDLIYLPHDTVLIVGATTGDGLQRGAVTEVTVRIGGRGWSAPTTLVTQLSASGSKLWDRVLNPATLAKPVMFRDLVLDGNWGGGEPAHQPLPVDRSYSGLAIRGAIEASIDGCTFRNFPNDGALMVDCKRGRLTSSNAFNCGWTGASRASRNGFSNGGIYVTTNAAALNTDDWLIADVVADCCGDVGIEYHWLRGTIRDVRISDFGTIGLEGQGTGSLYDTGGETRVENGGVPIPGDLIVRNVSIDGVRKISGDWATVTAPHTGIRGEAPANLPFGVDGWTHMASNEGQVSASDVTIRNVLRRGLAITQREGGVVTLTNSLVADAGRGSPAVTLNPASVVEIGAQRVFISGLRMTADGPVQSPSGRSAIALSQSRMLAWEIADCTFAMLPWRDLLQVSGQQGFVEAARFRRNTVALRAGSRVLEWVQQAHAKVAELDLSSNNIVNIAPAYRADQSYFVIRSLDGGRLNVLQLRTDDNTVTGPREDATPVVSFTAT